MIPLVHPCTLSTQIESSKLILFALNVKVDISTKFIAIKMSFIDDSIKNGKSSTSRLPVKDDE